MLTLAQLITMQCWEIVHGQGNFPLFPSALNRRPSQVEAFDDAMILLQSTVDFPLFFLFLFLAHVQEGGGALGRASRQVVY